MDAGIVRARNRKTGSFPRPFLSGPSHLCLFAKTRVLVSFLHSQVFPGSANLLTPSYSEGASLVLLKPHSLLISPPFVFPPLSHPCCPFYLLSSGVCTETPRWVARQGFFRVSNQDYHLFPDCPLSRGSPFILPSFLTTEIPTLLVFALSFQW